MDRRRPSCASSSSINGSTCGGGNVSSPGLSASIDVLQFLTTEAELANGSNAINVQSALGLTGVTASTLSLVVGQLPQVAYGPGRHDRQDRSR